MFFLSTNQQLCLHSNSNEHFEMHNSVEVQRPEDPKTSSSHNHVLTSNNDYLKKLPIQLLGETSCFLTDRDFYSLKVVSHHYNKRLHNGLVLDDEVRAGDDKTPFVDNYRYLGMLNSLKSYLAQIKIVKNPASLDPHVITGTNIPILLARIQRLQDLPAKEQLDALVKELWGDFSLIKEDAIPPILQHLINKLNIKITDTDLDYLNPSDFCSIYESIRKKLCYDHDLMDLFSIIRENSLEDFQRMNPDLPSDPLDIMRAEELPSAQEIREKWDPRTKYTLVDGKLDLRMIEVLTSECVEYLLSCTNLTSIITSSDNVTFLQTICKIKTLTEITLCSEVLAELPDTFANLPLLKKIDVWDCPRLKKIPKEILCREGVKIIGQMPLIFNLINKCSLSNKVKFICSNLFGVLKNIKRLLLMFTSLLLRCVNLLNIKTKIILGLLFAIGLLNHPIVKLIFDILTGSVLGFSLFVGYTIYRNPRLMDQLRHIGLRTILRDIGFEFYVTTPLK